MIHERSCEYAFFKFVILCVVQPPFPNLSLCLSFSSHTFLMGYYEKNLMARDRTPILFINQHPSSWFLFYFIFILFYFIITSHNNNCSCKEQIRSVRHKCHLTYIPAISSIGLFPSSRYPLGPGRGYLQKGLRSLSQPKLSKSQIR